MPLLNADTMTFSGVQTYPYLSPEEETDMLSYGLCNSEQLHISPPSLSSPTPTKRVRLTPPETLYEFQSDDTIIELPRDVQYVFPPDGEEAWQDPNFNNAQRLQRSPEALGYGYENAQTFRSLFSLRDSSNAGASSLPQGKRKMQTGCIPCLAKGIPCDPKNPGCKKAMSDDWNLNYENGNEDDGASRQPNGMSLTIFRPDTKWRRSWRERHSLNFFVNFSAPQMAGFFDSSFWQRMVIQTSYHEPAILHAITAIGALHECIMQRSFADERRKSIATTFALSQCNKAISYLMNRQTDDTSMDFSASSPKTPNSKLALTTCVLFTCFEAMQGRCDSAVDHALQGRQLLTATGRPNVTTMTPAEEDDLEQMRPIVERLEVQATALLDKGRRSVSDSPGLAPPLPPVEIIFSLDHAHNTLHTALNSIMRYMQAFRPDESREQIAFTMAEKYQRYGPWFAQWEQAFSMFLAGTRDSMPNMDLKRAMVLKANHLVGTMLSSVDQSAGPAAYDAYENEFKAVVDLSREVLSSFSSPPLPTLSGGSSGTPYLSFSLWVTDPLWMAISRCRHPSIRQAAFTLLSQNPRQEGIWHAGPQMLQSKTPRRTDSTPRADTANGVPAPMKRKHEGSRPGQKRAAGGVNGTTSNLPTREINEVPSEIEAAPIGGSMRERAEWIELKMAIDNAQAQPSESGEQDGREVDEVKISEHLPERYQSYCKGNCSIPTREQVGMMDEGNGEFKGPWKT